MSERLPAHAAGGGRTPEAGSATPLSTGKGGREAQIASLQQEVASARAEIERLSSRCAELERRLRQAEQVYDTLAHGSTDALRAELTAVRSSTSWQVTAPLRWAAVNLRTAAKLARSRRG